MHHMYSVTRSFDGGAVLQNLATLRPELILPFVIDQTYAALGNTIEVLTERLVFLTLTFL